MGAREMFRATEPIKVLMVRVRAIKPKYCMAGKPVEVGFEHDVPVGEAEDMKRRGLVEIVGTPRLENTGIIASDPSKAWAARW